MGATRLPGKNLMDLEGEPVLARVMHRIRRSTTIDAFVVATTEEQSDDPLAELCHSRGWRCFRGRESDVLDRYYRAACEVQADVVVRVTSDCPLHDSDVLDTVVREFRAHQPGTHYVSNVLERRTFPRGLDTEVMRFDALEKAWKEDENPVWREHVTPYIYRNPDSFVVHGVFADADYEHMRWTLDTPRDLKFIRTVYAHYKDDAFSWKDVLRLLHHHPEYLEINRDVEQKVVD